MLQGLYCTRSIGVFSALFARVIDPPVDLEYCGRVGGDDVMPEEYHARPQNIPGASCRRDLLIRQQLIDLRPA